MAIDRIGAMGKVTRGDASEGFTSLEKADARAQAKPVRNAKVDEVAKLYEKQFLREMVKAMRGTVSYDGVQKPSFGETVFKEQLHEQYVESWGDQGGIGLSDLIYDKIMERYFESGQGRGLKSQGSIALTDRDVSRVMRVQSSEVQGQVPLRVELKPSADGAPTKLKLPWDGEVISKNQVGGKTSLTFGHGEGLRSTLIFQGVASADAQPGEKLQRGQTLGVLSPEVDSFFWNLKSKGLTESALTEAGPDDGPAAKSE